VPVLRIQFKGVKHTDTVRIEVAKVDDDGKTLTLKDEDGSIKGSIDKSDVAGWWVEPNRNTRF
jgi:hypothetical protein